MNEKHELNESSLKVSGWSPDSFLNSPGAAAAYLEAAFEDGDPQLIVAALGDISKANGMTRLASESGLSRESLYKALSHKGNPRFATVLSVFRALNLKLRPVATMPEETRAHEFTKLWDHDFPSSKRKCYLFRLQDGEAQRKGVIESLECEI